MRILAIASEINQELIRLIEQCSTCQLAVAWASVGFPAFDLLVTNLHKIERMVVGTHFCQTHPQFIETFLNSENVRFVMNPNGVFHPKVYLFEKLYKRWECIIGSSNLTNGGISKNDEVAVLMTHEDHGAQEAIGRIKSIVSTYWRKSSQLTSEGLSNYQVA